MAFKYRARSQDDWDKRASQQGGEFKSYIKDEFRLYALKKGDNAIRILPPTWDDPRHYGIDIYVHFGIGPDKAAVLCPYKMHNHPCPICEARARAERAGDEDLEKDLRPSRRVLVWLVDRKDEEKGPVLWAMPWTVDRDIGKICRDRSTGDFYFIDHPDNGYDVYFDREGEGLTTKYTGFQLARRASSVDQDWLDFIDDNPLPEALLDRTYEELKELFEGASANAEPSRTTRDEPPARERRDRDDDRARDAQSSRSTRDDRRERDDDERRGRDDDDRRSGDREDSRRARDDRRDEPEKEEPRSERPKLRRADPEPKQDDRPRSNGRDHDDPPFEGGQRRADPEPRQPAETSGSSRAAALKERFSRR